MAVSAMGAGKGGGLLERPIIEKTTPGRESEFDLRYRLPIVLILSSFYFKSINLLIS